MASISRAKIANVIKYVKHDVTGDLSSKIQHLRRLRPNLLAADSSLLVDFLSPLIDLLSSQHSSPIRRFVTHLIGQIGLKNFELLPEIVPALIDALSDETPSVARQAIMSSVDIFRSTLVRVSVQGLYSSEVDESLKTAWSCVLQLKDEIHSMAFKAGSDGRRLAALKFVESVVLLYTPDPNGSLEPPSDLISDGNFEVFNVSWLRSGHAVLNVRDLSVEASRSLGLLLDQLRSPTLKSHSTLMIIVLIKSLSTVARKRPAFFGRILPVLLGTDPSNSTSRGMYLAGLHLALKNAFEACLNCSYPGAAPWRDRLVSAISDIKMGKLAQANEDEKPIVTFETETIVNAGSGRKRAGTLEMGDLSEEEGSGKRARSTPDSSERLGHDMRGKPEPSEPDTVSGPIQQLVAMFGALVAQGEKAAASLEILISSISADLLAEVVMANLRNLPSNFPQAEGDEESFQNAESVTHLRHLTLLLKGMFSVSTTSVGRESEMKESGYSVTCELEQMKEAEDIGEEGVEEVQINLFDSNIARNDSTHASKPATLLMSEPVSTEDIPSAMDTSYTYEVNDNEFTENEIPGLTFSTQGSTKNENVSVSSKTSSDFDEIGLTFSTQGGTKNENVPVFSKTFSDFDDSNQEVFTDSGETQVDIVQLLPIDKSEELSPKSEPADPTSSNYSLATQLVLPKISAPVVHLADEQKDHLQELAFERIVDAYKQVAIAGGSQVRFSILAHSGMEFPSELDPWKILKTHILSDYASHEGHELTLRVLYRLYGEAEENRDFFSSTTATSIYETFLLQVAETLRDSFPASDKSLGRLLGEVPYLPKSIMEILEQLCIPGTSENDDKELHGGDRVTQGLSTAWGLILLRPPIRDVCLQICLKCAVHHLEEVRMKAIRLVANKLYSLKFASDKIEDFANEMLVSVNRDDGIALSKETDGTRVELPKDESTSGENQSASLRSKEISSESHQLAVSESVAPSTVAEVQRLMSLYFALCTKKHPLLRQIFNIYGGTSMAAKQAIRGQIPLLVRTIGSSHDLLDVLSDPPAGSEGLVIQVVNTLTDGTVPSPDLVSTIKSLYKTKLKDVDVLIPILPFLAKDEVLLLFPHLVNTQLDKFQVIVTRVLQGLNHSAPILTPAEALIAIHGIDPEKDGIPLKKVTDACNACFEQRHIFTQQVLAKVLNQLVEQIPLPMLFMRTVLQAIGAFPSLVEFIMEILSRLVSKQIWKYPKLWVGFMKCALLTKPQSFGVLLQLPPAQLENALNRTSALKAPLVAHASQPHLRSSLPRSTLVVLGIVSEAAQSSAQTPPPLPPPPPPQTQTQSGVTETQTVEAGNSEKEEAPINSEKEEAPINSEKEEAPINSEKEEVTDKSKESPSTA